MLHVIGLSIIALGWCYLAAFVGWWWRGRKITRERIHRRLQL